MLQQMNSTEFLERLSAAQKLSRSAARRAEVASAKTGTPIESTLLEFGLVGEDELYFELAGFLGLPFVTDSDADPSLCLSLPLTLDFMERVEVVPVRETDDRLVLATSNPRGGDTVRAIGYHLNCPVDMAIAAPSTIKAILALATPEKNLSDDAISDRDIERLNQLANDGPVIKLVNDLIAQAAGERASDIHIEAGERDASVRFRIDGVLQSRRDIAQAVCAAVVSRMKVMANLNISEKRRPQDGRAQLSVRGRSIDIRLSTLPTQFGESIVLRLLDRSRLALDWGTLGYESDLAAAIERLVHQPNGIFLVAGPTGSGKTTTLYTALNGLNTSERKIVTVEDPIEFSLPGINQVQVEQAIEMGFPQALRAILRQDPDIIMVGEIRDAETAEIAVRAALVGRMVLSTVHTNDSVSAIPRLIDLGIPPYLLAATLRGVLSQRLVRRLCQSCSGSGCDDCSGAGHAGRRVLSELLTVGDDLSQAIADGADLSTLRRVARTEGFRDMEDHGRRLIAGGQIVQDDVLRAIGTFAL